MCELKLHCKLPIFVARQWVRHRTANVNEASGRYSILDREFYIPAPDVLGIQSAVNRQGRAETLSGEQAARVLELLKEDAARCYDHYQELLNVDNGGQPLRPGAPNGPRPLPSARLFEVLAGNIKISRNVLHVIMILKFFRQLENLFHMLFVYGYRIFWHHRDLRARQEYLFSVELFFDFFEVFWFGHDFKQIALILDIFSARFQHQIHQAVFIDL